MSAIKTIVQIKSHINEKYELSKEQLTGNKIVFNVKVDTLDKEYTSVIKNIDDEFTNFQQGKGHYSIFTSTITKEIKLGSELKMISDNFLRQIGILLDPKYMLALEEEVTEYEIQQKNLELLTNNAVFVGKFPY
jgi:hypothetical protein